MGWTPWAKMTDAQRLEAIKLRPQWHMSEFPRFDFYIRKDGHLSLAPGGGSHSLSDESCAEELRKLGGAIRSKGDNREWKPGVTFHFNPRSE